ncbi:MAG: MBL fold metallo-hydrolase, partial [Lachnospiraceae bacterium]|nr:MBL fold metallo-hydrolase [Lachnospiraceae bacterium]
HLKGMLGYDAIAPYSGDTYDLLENVCIRQGDRKLAERRKEKKLKASSNVFARLLAAGHRLLSVIQKNEGLANKDIAKFADQINALSDKWDR